MVLPEAHASEGKPISSPGRSRFTDSLAPPRTQQSISLKHRLHSTSKLDLRDHCSDHGSVRPQNPRMLLTKKNPFLFLVTRFFFLETNSRFRWPKAATATSGVHPTVFSLPRWQPGDAPPSTMRRGSFSPPSSLGGVVSNGPATMDPSSPPLTQSKDLGGKRNLGPTSGRCSARRKARFPVQDKARIPYPLIAPKLPRTVKTKSAGESTPLARKARALAP